MKRNVFFEIQLEPSDYKNLLLSELKMDSFHPIYVKEETDHGFFTTTKLPNQGLYVLYKKKQPIYVGCSKTSIHNRVGRFVAGVRGTERHDESHPAAYKYIAVFGRDLSDLNVKSIPLKQDDLPDYLVVQDIEQTLIKELKPLFNNETHYNYTFEKGVKITPVQETENARFI